MVNQKIILVMGKGGVGKSTISHAIARALAQKGKRVLHCEVLQIDEMPQKLEEVERNLWHITLNASTCFEEYVQLKLKLKSLYSLFLNNKMIQYMERAAPGIRELVLLGKIWYERQHYDHVIVDMASTGYALIMLHTPFNFAKLFPGGPIYNDAVDMGNTLSDPNETRLIALTLAEEMPAQETIELATQIQNLLPNNPPTLIVNRLLRSSANAAELHTTEALQKKQITNHPLWKALDHVVKKQGFQQAQIGELRAHATLFRKNFYTFCETPDASTLTLKDAHEEALK